MNDPFLSSLALVGTGGHLIMGAIVVLLGIGVLSNFYIRGRYALLERELRYQADSLEGGFRAPVLNRIVHEVSEAFRRGPREVNTQAIIEHSVHAELRGLLLGERFGKSSIGLMIILGLVGTFYGLTMSIGQLVALVSGEPGKGADITQSLTAGLTDALAGMSVAFSVSLFGIGAAITMTVLGIFSSIPDRRLALMVRIEHFVDNVLVPALRGGEEAPAAPGDPAPALATRRLGELVAGFGQSVERLDAVIARFDQSLQGFASNTRDFREFNLHLKDNVQRMSLTFADLSEAVKTQVAALRQRDPR